MTQEEIDFTYFKDHQLHCVDFLTGRIDIKIGTKAKDVFRYAYDVGSLNQDGYERIWCNRHLRMKHRLLFWLYHGYLPSEVDHDNKARNHNSIGNLIASNRSGNTTGKTPRSYSQLTETQVHEVCKRLASGSESITKIANDVGKSRVQIKAILTKKYRSAVSDLYF